jgi:hypothetical protein
MSDNLEEKFVSDDGISTVPAPVTGAGGEIKKKLADVKKKVHPTADNIEKTVKTPVKEEAEEEEVITFDESIEAMFEGMDLSEEFRSKVTLVFEAAVNEATKARLDEAVEELEEQFEQRLTESVNEAMEEIVENLDSYLDYVVAEWMEENEVAIEAGIKVEMAESLMDGLRELFTEHNLDVDEETLDVVTGLEEEMNELQTRANEVINENIELAREVAALRADRAFAEVAEGLTVSQAERLRILAEKLDHSDLDSYEADLNTLRESFFKDSRKTIAEETEEEGILVEETTRKPASPYSTVSALVEALERKNAK